MSQNDRPTYVARFTEYFARPVSEQAAAALANGAEIQFEIVGHSSPFTFTRKAGKNTIIDAPALHPQLKFILNPRAAEEVLGFASDDLGEIGIHILKMVMRSDSETEPKIRLEICAGFITLFSKGYFGVLKGGGTAFASFLASKGFSGIGAIKAALSKAMKNKG